MDYIQILLLALVIVVWTLLYSVWKAADVFILLEEGGDGPPHTLFEIIERNKSRMIQRPDDSNRHFSEVLEPNKK